MDTKNKKIDIDVENPLSEDELIRRKNECRTSNSTHACYSPPSSDAVFIVHKDSVCVPSNLSAIPDDDVKWGWKRIRYALAVFVFALIAFVFVTSVDGESGLLSMLFMGFCCLSGFIGYAHAKYDYKVDACRAKPEFVAKINHAQLGGKTEIYDINKAPPPRSISIVDHVQSLFGINVAGDSEIQNQYIKNMKLDAKKMNMSDKKLKYYFPQKYSRKLTENKKQES